MYFFSIFFKNLWRRPVRSMLTILGLAMAIGTMLLLRGASLGFERSFLATLERRGLDLVVVAAGVPDQLRSDLAEEIGSKVEQIPGVESVFPGLIELIDVQKGDGLLSVLVHGWEIGCPLFEDFAIVAGRFLRTDDRQSVLIGDTLQVNLGKQVGDEIQLQGEPFRVVGVYHSNDVFENGSVIMSLPELQTLMAREGSVTGFSVRLTDFGKTPAELDRIVAAVAGLKDAQGRPYRINAQATRRYINGMVHLKMAKGMAWFTSAVAVVIGVIGMLNTMLMSVLERTREIGVLRAIGWRKSRVLRMILGETAILGSGGALLGCFAAALGLQILRYLPRTSGFVSGEMAPRVLLEGLALTLLVVVLGGLYPAWRAAQLLPTEALRHE